MPSITVQGPPSLLKGGKYIVCMDANGPRNYGQIEQIRDHVCFIHIVGPP